MGKIRGYPTHAHCPRCGRMDHGLHHTTYRDTDENAERPDLKEILLSLIGLSSRPGRAKDFYLHCAHCGCIWNAGSS